MIEDTLSSISDTLGTVSSQFQGTTPVSQVNELSDQEMSKRKTTRLVIALVLAGIVIALIVRKFKK